MVYASSLAPSPSACADAARRSQVEEGRPPRQGRVRRRVAPPPTRRAGRGARGVEGLVQTRHPRDVPAREIPVEGARGVEGVVQTRHPRHVPPRDMPTQSRIRVPTNPIVHISVQIRVRNRTPPYLVGHPHQPDNPKPPKTLTRRTPSLTCCSLLFSDILPRRKPPEPKPKRSNRNQTPSNDEKSPDSKENECGKFGKTGEESPDEITNDPTGQVGMRENPLQVHFTYDKASGSGSTLLTARVGE